MRSNRRLLADQLDKKLQPFREAEKVIVPEPGWIYTIRTALNIKLDQLARKLQVTRQGIKKMEERESSGAITINALRDIGKAMDMKFIYGFIPADGTIENLIERKSAELAKKIVLRTHQQMKLEDQGNSAERIEKAIQELTMELKQEINKAIWD